MAASRAFEVTTRGGAGECGVGSRLSRTLAIVCLHLLAAQLLCDAASSHPPSAEERLGHQCKRISSIKRLSEMQELIDNLQQVVDKQQQQQQQVKTRPSDGTPSLRDIARPTVALTSTLAVSLTGSYSAPLRFFSQNPSGPCLAQAKAILDLAALIGEHDNVCSSEHLSRIERYYERHLKAYYAYGEQLKARAIPVARSYSMRVGSSSKPAAGAAGAGATNNNNNAPLGKPITTKFFQLYANQVAFVCKSNLLHSLHAVDDSGLITPSDYDKVMPWLTQKNTETCKRVESLVVDQQQERDNATPSNLVTQAKSLGVTGDDLRHCNARKLLMELSNVDELVEVIESSETFFKVDNTSQQRQQQQQEGTSQGASDAKPTAAAAPQPSGLFLIVPENQKQVVGDMLTTCAKLRPIYEQTVLPIVRLARLGFNPAHTNFDRVCSGDQLIKRWFGLTLVCNSMLSSRLPNDLEKYKELVEDNNMARKSFVVVDDDDGTHEMSSSMAAAAVANQKLDLINEEDLRPLIKNSIEDELWIYKYGTTKLQRIKDSIIKKVFKLFKVEDINSHVVFRKRVLDTNRWIVRIVLITLALVTFDHLLK